MSANTYLKDEERQILESATVGIAGAGGLGSNCAAHLVRAGLKRLVIADFDVVSKSNLNRQFFFLPAVAVQLQFQQTDPCIVAVSFAAQLFHNLFASV